MNTSRMHIAEIELCILSVSPATRWAFVQLIDNDGQSGWGEATLNGREPELLRAFQALATRLIGLDLRQLKSACQQEISSATHLATAAIASSLNQAAWDLGSQREGVTVVDLIGGSQRTEVPLYANINRQLVDRSAAGVAQAVHAARANGFNAIKIAPFDEVRRDLPAEHQAAEVQKGLARIRAARDAAGHECLLMADCHWRLDATTALGVIQACGELGLHWLECPIPERQSNLDDLRQLRRAAHAQGMLLAGCEEAVSWEGIRPFVAAGAYDVYMPDIKYIGGIDEMLRVSEELAAHGLSMSPHNPSGPIAHAASVHVCAAAVQAPLLEHQYEETPYFERLVGGSLGRIVRGHSQVPRGLGLGVSLQPRQVERCITQRYNVRAH